MKKHKKNSIPIKTVRNMARFFLKKLFYGIPEIHISYGKTDDGASGEFVLKRNEDYDAEKDEMIDAPEYHQEYIQFYENYPDLGGFYLGKEYSWEDPQNHPQVSITIRRDAGACCRRLVSVLLHELLHYYCWYVGLESHDGDRDFEEKCKEMGLQSNFEGWKWTNGGWVKKYDYTQMDKYIRMYLDHKADQTLEKMMNEAAA